jgi:putative membrane protein
MKTSHTVLLGIVVVVLAASGIGPSDRLTWVLEILPIVIAIPILAVTYHSFRLTDLTYGLITIHAAILAIGGHYTYAEVPLGFWVADWFDLARNHYDRLGHLAQGFVPAIIAREILLRKTPLQPGRWLSVLCVCFCLAFSAFYEILEWWVGASLEQDADAFLGTQGDPWDTQWDMFLALCGAIMALVLLSRIHDRYLGKLLNR